MESENVLMVGLVAVALIIVAMVWLQAGSESRPQPPVELNLTNLSGTPLITVSGDENISVARIYAADLDGEWQFPLEDYTDEFIAVGLHSDSFIRLNSSQILFLEDDESIWLTPMLDEGQAVLFNAIYSKEMDSCSASTVKILGKDYDVSELEMKSGSAFESDDKWKVMLEHDGACLKCIVLYLDGYFYDIKEGEQLNLFRNDNTILFRFKDLASEPKIEVVGTKPLENGFRAVTKEAYTRTSTITDLSIGKNYTEKETIDSGGLYLEFEPAIPICTGKYCASERWDRTESQRLILDIADEEWVIFDFWKNSSEENVTIAKEKEHGIMHSYGCEGAAWMEEGSIETINVSGVEWGVADFSRIQGPQIRYGVIFFRLDTKNQTLVPEGEPAEIDSEFVHVWVVAPGYLFCDDWARVSVFSDVVSLSDSANNATLTWENETSDNPALKSIFVPRSSPIFEKLTGQSNS